MINLSEERRKDKSITLISKFNSLVCEDSYLAENMRDYITNSKKINLRWFQNNIRRGVIIYLLNVNLKFIPTDKSDDIDVGPQYMFDVYDKTGLDVMHLSEKSPFYQALANEEINKNYFDGEVDELVLKYRPKSNSSLILNIINQKGNRLKKSLRAENFIPNMVPQFI